MGRGTVCAKAWGVGSALEGSKTWDHLASWLIQAHAWVWGEGS